MAFKGQLNIDSNKTFNILKLSYAITQRIDGIGRPISIAKGGVIHITVETSNETLLLEWMMSPNMIKSGFVLLEDRSVEGKAMRTLYFNDAFCINYNELFDAVNSKPMITELTLSARVIHFGSDDLELVNDWPGEYDKGEASSRKSDTRDSSGHMGDDSHMGNPSTMY